MVLADMGLLGQRHGEAWRRRPRAPRSPVPAHVCGGHPCSELSQRRTPVLGHQRQGCSCVGSVGCGRLVCGGGRGVFFSASRSRNCFQAQNLSQKRNKEHISQHLA